MRFLANENFPLDAVEALCQKGYGVVWIRTESPSIGFRYDWGRDLFADVRSVVNTGKRQGLSAFEAICAVLDPTKPLFPLG
jgi:hypothetical protein